MDNRNELISDKQNQNLIISKDNNVLSEISSDELRSLLDEKKNIQNELVSLRDKILTLEKRKTDIDIEIQRISAANIKQELEDDLIDDIDKEKAVEGVRPKPLTIKGFDDIYNVLYKHVYALDFSRYDKPYDCLGSQLIAVSYVFSYIGKEVLFFLNEKPDDEQMKEWKSIIDTCDKISNIKNNGDKEGYKKYLDYFLQKYPLPTYPEETFLGPDLYLKNESVYEDAYLLMKYIIRFKEQIKEKCNIDKNTKYNYLYDDYLIFDECTIDNIYVWYMKIIYMLRKKGYTLAIVPILDENILYRPKRVAQAGEFFSLYYYDDYVETPFMVKDNIHKSQSPSSYYSVLGGYTYVSGHYRSGHWRNGRYVKGGYVKGHYRR